MANELHWRCVGPNLWCYPDSCNVYAIEGPAGTLIVDAGTGHWLDHLDELPQPPVALVLTHFFRDHSAGAVRAIEAGIAVYAGEYEREILTDPVEHFRRRETYIIYDNQWDLFGPIEPIPLAGVLQDYQRTQLAGIDVEVIPLPGVTMTQIGLAVTMPGQDRPIVFCGEAIHSPGRLARVAPLQYNYSDLPGAINCFHSAHVLRQHRPAALLPSLGEPIVDDPDVALLQLQDNLVTLCEGRPDMRPLFETCNQSELIKVSEHVYIDSRSVALSCYILSESGKAMAIDYGYRDPLAFPSYHPHFYTRRPLLHGLDALQEQFGIDRLDMVLASHFHDDHICGIPMLQRLHGTSCWAGDNFADLLEHPEANRFPAVWPMSIKVDRRLPLDEPVQWEEYTFHLTPMSGHTRFSMLIGFEADGKRFAHTGDQYFFLAQDAPPQMSTEQLFRPGMWHYCVPKQNHVYANGAVLDSYEHSGAWLLDWRPDIILNGHQPPMHTDEQFFKMIDNWTDYRRIHQQVMPLGDQETHFNLDSLRGWIRPYRVHLNEPRLVQVTVTARNPLPRRATISLRTVGPRDWTGESATIEAPPRAEVNCELSITPDGPCRRQPFVVEMQADGQPFGQIAEALMTVGGSAW